MLNNEVLKKCDIFSGLTPGEISKIAQLTSEKEYEAGMVIFQENEPVDKMFILKEGKVALQMISSVLPGRTITVDVALIGDVLGWAPLVELNVHDLRALCLQKTRLLSLDISHLRQLFKEDCKTHVTVMKGIAYATLMRLNDTRQLLASERIWLQKIE